MKSDPNILHSGSHWKLGTIAVRSEQFTTKGPLFARTGNWGRGRVGILHYWLPQLKLAHYQFEMGDSKGALNAHVLEFLVIFLGFANRKCKKNIR